MSDAPNSREGTQARKPSKCLNRQSYGERLAKEAFWLPATRGFKKHSGRPITPAAEAVRVPAHLAQPGSPRPEQLSHLHTQPSLGQSYNRQNVLRRCTWDCFGHVQFSENLRTVACQASLSVGFSRQEYWNVLDNTGCYTLLKCYISCCPSHQLPWISAARNPVTQAAPSPHLALTGADPSPPGQPQEQIPVDDPHAEVEIKPQLKPRGSVAKEEDPKTFPPPVQSAD